MLNISQTIGFHLLTPNYVANGCIIVVQKWVQSHGYRTGQAMMLWKRMYGNNIWAHHIDELEGYFFFISALHVFERGEKTSVL